jgi:hypothetical protein
MTSACELVSDSLALNKMNNRNTFSRFVVNPSAVGFPIVGIFKFPNRPFSKGLFVDEELKHAHMTIYAFSTMFSLCAAMLGMFIYEVLDPNDFS